jgi:alpha-N-arabinofuranosidase
VRLWEIGNEPYLRLDVHPELSHPPADVARTIDRFISAMRAVDPSIRVIVPLRSDQISGVPATPFPGYNAAVLAGTHERYDFVSLHNAYLPFAATGRAPSDRDLFLALMAAPVVVQRDLMATRAAVARARPNTSVGVAVTEYNALVTIGRGRSDAYIASQAGALYIADLLRLFAQMDVDIANFWSLNGNWYFGAVSNQGELRPAYFVLAAFDSLLRGSRLPVQVQSPGFDNPAVGWVAGMNGTPLVSALATREGDTLRVLLINKSADAPASVTLQLPASPRRRLVAASQMVARSPFEVSTGNAAGWQPVALASADSMNMAPYSLLQLEYLLSR